MHYTVGYEVRRRHFAEPAEVLKYYLAKQVLYIDFEQLWHFSLHNRIVVLADELFAMAAERRPTTTTMADHKLTAAMDDRKPIATMADRKLTAMADRKPAAAAAELAEHKLAMSAWERAPISRTSYMQSDRFRARRPLAIGSHQ